MEELAIEGPEAFYKLYRMDYSTFKKLCDNISPKILVNDEMSRCRTGKDAITVEMMLHCLLRWLGGVIYLDIRLSAGISPAKFYSCIYKCIDAIFNSEALTCKFPSTTRALD